MTLAHVSVYDVQRQAGQNLHHLGKVDGSWLICRKKLAGTGSIRSLQKQKAFDDAAYCERSLQAVLIH